MRGLFPSDAKRLCGNRAITLPRIEPYQDRLGGRIALAAAIGISGQILTLQFASGKRRERRLARVTKKKYWLEAGSRNRNQSTLIARDWNLNAGESRRS